MLSLVQHYLNAVKDQNYQLIASILQVYPHMKHLNVFDKHPLVHAVKINDPTMVELYWALLEDRNNFGKLPFTHKLFSFTKGSEAYDACEDILFKKTAECLSKVNKLYSLDNAKAGLSDEIFKLHAEQLFVLTGCKPTVHQVLDISNEQQSNQVMRFELTASEASKIINLKCALQLQGLNYSEQIRDKETYVLEISDLDALEVARVFETGDFSTSVGTTLASDSFIELEKIRLFEMCFENRKETKSILDRFRESPLYNLYETKQFKENMTDGFSAWIGHFAKDYLKGISVPSEQLIEDVGQGHEQGMQEFLSKALGLPPPNKLMGDLRGLTPVHKEILFEICFTPNQFIKNFVERIKFPYDIVDAQTLLRGEVERYQLAMNEHLPSKVHEDHLQLNAWQFRGKGHYKGITILYDNPQIRASTQQLGDDQDLSQAKPSLAFKY